MQLKFLVGASVWLHETSEQDIQFGFRTCFLQIPDLAIKEICSCLLADLWPATWLVGLKVPTNLWP